MKVVVIAGSSWSLVHFRLRLLLSIRKAGHSISAISIDGESQEQIASILSVHGIEHISLGASRSGVNILKEIYHFLSLYRIVLTLKPDLVFAYTAKAVIYGGLVSRVCKIGSFFPMITGLGYAFTSVVGFKRIFIRHLVRLLYKLGLSRARTTIFQNTDDLELFHQLNIISKKSYSRLVNGSGVDLDAFPLKQLPGKPVFLMLSRLVADKGVREYVEAARIIKQERPNAVFRLAGGLDVNPTSINDEELNRWIEDDVIEYFGKVDTVQWLLEQCRFYVLPSYREGVPRSVLEAMATGRPDHH